MRKTFHSLPFVLILFVYIVQSGFSGGSVAGQSVASWHNDYDVKFYYLNIDANDTTTSIKGGVSIQSEVKTDILSSFIFELQSKMAIDSVKCANQKLLYQQNADLVTATLPSGGYTKGQSFTVTVYYKGSVNVSGFFSPLANQTDTRWKIPVTWTLSEPLSAKFWFPCKQVNADKADSAWIFITVPKRCKAGSNGVLTGITNVSAKKTRYEWKVRNPIAFYLISFAVADYQDYSFYARLNQTDSVLVQNYIYNRPDYLETNRINIDNTAKFLRFYSSVYGTYPFRKEKYGHCLAPMGGGMENQTMTTLSSFETTLVAHELAHQWFGDYVTCADWQNIWLNEGFASYSEYLTLENLTSPEQASSWMRTCQQSAMSDGNGSVCVPAEDAENENRIFSYSLSYKKGAAILHMLRYELSDDALFYSVLRTYLEKYKNSVATADNFFDVVKQVSGKDYRWFEDQWFYGKGYPNFDISWKYADHKLMINSHQTPSGATPLFKTHIDIRLFFNSGDTTIRVWQDQADDTFSIPVSKEVIDIDFDPQSRILKKVKIDKVPYLPSSDNYFQVVGNPFSQNVHLIFSTNPDDQRTIRIIDLKGRQITTIESGNKKDVYLDSSSWSLGTYLIHITDGSKQYTRKIIKTR